jgi:hypothetical protein
MRRADRVICLVSGERPPALTQQSWIGHYEGLFEIISVGISEHGSEKRIWSSGVW